MLRGLRYRKTVMSPGRSGLKGHYARTVNLFIQRTCGGTLSSSFGTFPELRIILPLGAGTFIRLTNLELLPGPCMKDYWVCTPELCLADELSLDYKDRKVTY